MKFKSAIPGLTANPRTSHLIKKPSAGYLFLVTHLILITPITLNIFGIELLTLPMHLLQFLLCLPPPPKQDGVRNLVKVCYKAVEQKGSNRGNKSLRNRENVTAKKHCDNSVFFTSIVLSTKALSNKNPRSFASNAR